MRKPSFQISQDEVNAFPIISAACAIATLVSHFIFEAEMRDGILFAVFLVLLLSEFYLRKRAIAKWNNEFEQSYSNFYKMIHSAEEIRDRNEQIIKEYIDILEQAEKKGELTIEIQTQLGLLRGRMNGK